tara:strand:- start:2331 stop:3461 length:1131 start_codon:yes stop_codon:yes gene_type:complete
MGKKNKSAGKKELPFVSVCTPTFNRRPFIPYAIKCFQHQDYPQDRMEWIVIDDGSDKVDDLFKDIPNVKYFYYDEKMPLGKKRNIMHKKSKGDIIVYMDDDDYYPKQRVSHAVEMLQSHPSALAAGCSEIYIWFKHIQQMYQFGPYGPNHATAGTFAFKRELLKDHAYEEHAALAEEKAFLKNYTVPFVQLEPKKVILVFSHNQNTFDKKKLLANGDNKFQKPSERTVDEFVKEDDLKDFYMNKIDDLLANYAPGDPENKPDVLKQIKEIEAERAKMIQQQQQSGGQIMITKDGQQIPLKNDDIIQILQGQQKQLGEQQEQLKKLVEQLQIRDNIIMQLKGKLEEFEKDNSENMNYQTNYNSEENQQNTVIENSEQ